MVEPVRPAEVRRRRRRLTYSDVASTIALVAALSGGAAYAATALPDGSVGTEQIRVSAVTGSRIAAGAVTGRHIAPRTITGGRVARWTLARRHIAPGAITLDRLSGGLRARVLETPDRGATGPTGPAGPPGPGAARLRLNAAASPTPTPVEMLRVPGLTVAASCVAAGGDTAMAMSLTPAEDVTINETVTIDAGTDLSTPGTQMGTQNIFIALPGGIRHDLGGPSASDGYTRVMVDLIAAMPSRTISMDIALIVDDANARCSADGVAVTAE